MRIDVAINQHIMFILCFLTPHPWPHTVSHTDAKFQELFPGDSVAGIVLMDAELLKKTVLGSEKE